MWVGVESPRGNESHTIRISWLERYLIDRMRMMSIRIGDDPFPLSTETALYVILWYYGRTPGVHHCNSRYQISSWVTNNGQTFYYNIEHRIKVWRWRRWHLGRRFIASARIYRIGENIGDIEDACEVPSESLLVEVPSRRKDIDWINTHVQQLIDTGSELLGGTGGLPERVESLIRAKEFGTTLEVHW